MLSISRCCSVVRNIQRYKVCTHTWDKISEIRLSVAGVSTVSLSFVVLHSVNIYSAFFFLFLRRDGGNCETLSDLLLIEPLTCKNAVMTCQAVDGIVTFAQHAA